MHNINKRVIPVFLIAAVLFFSAEGHSDPARIQIPLLMDDTRIYLAAELWYEPYGTPVMLTASQVQTTNDKAINCLSQYYFWARTNQVAQLETLYAEIDGSLGTLKRQVLTTPGLFSPYVQLETVSINAKALWGLYQFFPVALSGAGKTTQWYETLLCDNVRCLMSTSMESMSKEEMIWKNTLVTARKLDDIVGRIDPAVLSQMIATLKLQDKKIMFLPSYAPVGSDAYPLSMYAHLIGGGDMVVPIDGQEDPPQENIPLSFRALIDMIRTARTLPYGQFVTGIQDAWSGLPGDGFYTMTVKQISGADEPSVSISGSAPHSWNAFHLRINQWDSLRLLAMAHDTGKTWLFVEPTLKNGDGMDTMQLFCITLDNGSGKYRIEDDSVSDLPLQIIKSGTMMQFIYEQYK